MKKKIKFLTIAGTRPNFVKIAPLLEGLARFKRIQSVLVHTGQHYDYKMSQSFFDELEIKKPNYFLGVGSGSHAMQTAKAMEKIEKVIISEKPDLVILVGDVNSTLAGAITASKLHIPIAHIEAGQRSFDREMPEEINRTIVSQLAKYHFAAMEKDVDNLINEGVSHKNIYYVGNIMVDTLLKSKSRAFLLSKRLMQKYHVEPQKYVIMTLHRAGNTDSKENLSQIFQAVKEINKKVKIIFTVHPRTAKMIKEFKLEDDLKKIPGLKMINPVSYLEMLCLVSNCSFVLSDSGGLQHETTILNIPCLTMKKTSEWGVTVDKGTNIVVGTNKNKIVKEAFKIISGKKKNAKKIKNWDGKTAERIVKILLEKFNG
jgi:UDP-N-acetylglucosamine 2-epimerase (non-hydrolysing)